MQWRVAGGDPRRFLLCDCLSGNPLQPPH